MFNKSKTKKFFFQAGLALSATLTAAFVFFGFINTDVIERAEARSYISVAEHVYMQERINELVAQAMEAE
mgnify:CR=1 FL=1|tara:strand:- start:1301 stop:1510 length:210 start_codon:yes stop_codon:yes gene_type:complete